MEEFLKGLPETPGAAFLVAAHFDPDRESFLHEILATYTTLSVCVAKDGEEVEVNRIYVVPPGRILALKGRRIALSENSRSNLRKKPIDSLLSSLAEAQREYSVAVILSGGNSDGTLGAKVVKECGGLTLAQAGGETGPSMPDMPLSAIAAGLVDHQVPAGRMGKIIASFADSFGKLPDFADDDKGDEEARISICKILSTRTGHDFSGYKAKTFLRRVRRRMQVRQLLNIEDYVRFLEESPSEPNNLFRDLLINVTNFFRDADAFETLRKSVVPALFENKDGSGTVRIWVPGCATGEEAYSLAILMQEHRETLKDPPRSQIFATDIDEAALAVARSARYPHSLMENVSAERRRRFFVEDGDSYVVTPGIRKLCLFSPQNILQDPPFSRIDLVSCRNVMIYFGPDLQKRALPVFRYALRPEGYLFLGTSESIGKHGDLFTAVDKKNRLFKARKLATGLSRPLIPVVDQVSMPATRKRSVSAKGISDPVRQRVQDQILEQYAPAHVVVNSDGEALYFSNGIGSFLQQPQGEPSRQVLVMARKGLGPDLRAALREAVASHSRIRRESLLVGDEDDTAQPLRLTIEPLSETGLFLVVFQPDGPSRGYTERELGAAQADATAELERELRETRERLQSTIEEYESALDELKSSNEELISVNEEAQSTNEELEASKEEMQSLNEELNTINSELNQKMEQLHRVNSDLNNLFESTQIATIFLNKDLVIRRFTPAASKFFNLRSADVGRPLTDLSNRLDYPELHVDLQRAYEADEVLERKLPRDSDGQHHLVRLVPYHDDAGRPEGIVVTMLDVTTLAESEEHQKILVGELNHRVMNLLGVVNSFAKQTFEGAGSLDVKVPALIGRLQAMSRAYALLVKSDWKNVSLDEVIRQEANQYDLARISIDGPDVQLKPQLGLSMGLVVHELAVNAMRHGALRESNGQIKISWHSDGDALDLTWQEKNGPPAIAPDAEGFGLTLIRGEIEYRLGGTVRTEFDEAGLRVKLNMDLGR